MDKKNIKKTEQNQEPQSGILDSYRFKFTSSYEVWNFLFRKKGKESASSRKFTKPEAFFDLLQRQRLYLLTFDDNFVSGSINSLAQAWHWDRSTVKGFLAELESMKAIAFCVVGRKTTIQVLNFVREDSETSSMDTSNSEESVKTLSNKSNKDGH